MIYRDRVFRNAMTIEIAMEVLGLLCDKPVLLDVSVVALVTTVILWHVFLAGDKKQRKRPCSFR